MLCCPVCENNIDEKIFVREYFSKHSHKQYHLYYCRFCDHMFWYPGEVDRKLYESENFSSYAFLHRGIYRLRKVHEEFIKSLGDLEKYRNKKILDIGCGEGSLLKYLESLGLDVYGIDIDSKSIDAAKKYNSLKNVYNMSVEEFVDYALKNGLRFDIITFFDVIEHNPNLLAFLDSVKKLLNKGGIIVGTVPNRDRFLAFLREFDSLDFPPHHFHWFSKKSIQNMFIRLGFETKVYSIGVKFSEALQGAKYLLHSATGMRFFENYDRKSIFEKVYKLAFGVLFYMLLLPLTLFIKIRSFNSVFIFFCKVKS